MCILFLYIVCILFFEFVFYCVCIYCVYNMYILYG